MNLPKTMLVPLWESTVRAITNMIRDDFPQLAAMTVTYKAKCLGIWMGLGGGQYAWVEATGKFLKATIRWSADAWGLQLSTLIYNVYIASILGFVAQFYPPTKEVEAESLALRRFNRGPGNWCTTKELFHLDSW